ncbi:hypothetical protein WMY93_002082 [Mugilogobius chulae]|uniref:Uncharacterized protein n=1 Tax=Mugilogobius chulae TaxID=88201 RepID=A0AAW0PSM5_9GOBI
MDQPLLKDWPRTGQDPHRAGLDPDHIRTTSDPGPDRPEPESGQRHARAPHHDLVCACARVSRVKARVRVSGERVHQKGVARMLETSGAVLVLTDHNDSRAPAAARSGPGLLSSGPGWARLGPDVLLRAGSDCGTEAPPAAAPTVRSEQSNRSGTSTGHFHNKTPTTVHGPVFGPGPRLQQLWALQGCCLTRNVPHGMSHRRAHCHCLQPQHRAFYCEGDVF